MDQAISILRAGALSMLWENGALRYISYQGSEVLRSIYFALRDQNWGTVPYILTILEQEIHTDSFYIRFIARHCLNDQPVFSWDATFRGNPDSSIFCSIKGTALQPFWRNRAGFCVLHPIAECAGKSVRITEPDGHTCSLVFPQLIAPDRPFPIMHAMEWEIDSGIQANLAFAGDDFETEDQRNWTDTSFKTFCTPLGLPKPVLLEPLSTLEQSISLALQPRPLSNTTSFLTDDIEIHFGGVIGRLPAIGTLQPLALTQPSLIQAKYLKVLRLDHLRIEVRLMDTDWRQQWVRGLSQASALDLPILLALSVGDDALGLVLEFLEYLNPHVDSIKAILLFQQFGITCTNTTLNTLIPLFRAACPSAEIGSGVQTNYCELGRNLIDAQHCDVMAFAVQPQEHAFDDLSLVENLESQADVVHSARALYPHQQVYISPLTLRKRFNPYANDPQERFVEQPLSVQADPRQTLPFAASWLLGSIKTLAEAQTHTLTVFRAFGELSFFDAFDKPCPTYYLLLRLSAWQGANVIQTISSAKLSCSGLLLEKEGRNLLILANHTPQKICIRVDAHAAKYPLEPYEIVYIRL